LPLLKFQPSYIILYSYEGLEHYYYYYYYHHHYHHHRHAHFISISLYNFHIHNKTETRKCPYRTATSNTQLSV